MSGLSLDRSVRPAAEPVNRPWRAVLGAAVMALALGAGPALSGPAARTLGLGGFPARLLPAVLVSAIAVPLILLMRSRYRIPAHAIGLTGPGSSAAGFGLGIGVVGIAALVTLGLGTAGGLLRWRAADPGALAGFLVTNTIIAILLEALPEELTLRGFTFGILRRRHRAVWSGVLTTALFLVVPAGSAAVNAGITVALGGDAPPIGLAPAGEDPVAYVVLLILFGAMLVTARTATASTTVWTCVGAHLTFLTVNRIALFGEDRDAGWSAELVSQDAVLLVPAYLLTASVAFAIIGRTRRRRQAA